MKLRGGIFRYPKAALMFRYPKGAPLRTVIFTTESKSIYFFDMFWGIFDMARKIFDIGRKAFVKHLFKLPNKPRDVKNLRRRQKSFRHFKGFVKNLFKSA